MIQFGGLASGLDTNAIIQAILGVERVPITQLQSNRETEQRKLSLLGTLEGHVKTLRDRAEDLSTRSGLLSHRVTPSAEGVASFSVTGDVEAGSHTLVVEQLASSSRFTFSDLVNDADLDLGAGDIEFDVDGTHYTLSVAAGDSSLNEIRDALNALAGDDVTASVVNVGTTSSPQYQLVIAGKETGQEHAISGLTSSVAGLTDGNIVELTTAQNARVVVDGLTVERATNVFDGVVEGLSFTAQAADAAKTISFVTELDTDGIVEKLQGFVDAYNDVIEFIGSQSTFSEDNGAGGPLFGDPILRSVRSAISSPLFSLNIATVVADTEGFSTLQLLGIDLQSDGTLSLDEEQVAAKLAQDPDAFADFFVDTDGFDNGGASVNTAAYFVDQTADDGIFDNLFRSLDQLVDGLELSDGSQLDGLFDLRKETINKNIARIDDRIEVLEERLDATEQQLITRFSALEQLIAGLNSQGSFLSSLSSLTAQQS